MALLLMIKRLAKKKTATPLVQPPSSGAAATTSLVKTSPTTAQGSKLPAELLILCFLPLHPVDFVVDGPSFLVPSPVAPDLCNVARVCRFWAACAQTVLFKEVHLNQRTNRIIFCHSIDPKTQRGRSLGELVVKLTIHYDLERSQVWKLTQLKKLHGRIDLMVNSSSARQIVQRCPKLHSLRLVHRRQLHSPPDMEFRISSLLTLSPNLRHLCIRLFEYNGANPLPSPATMEVYRLIASSPSTTALRLFTEFDPKRSPPIPPVSWLSPSFKLQSLLARRLDELALWALHYSKESLEHLHTFSATTMTMRQIGKDFPNVTTLIFHQLKAGDSLEEFQNLRTLYCLGSHAENTSFLSRLPKSIRRINFRNEDLVPALRELVRSGALPNIQRIVFQRPIAVTRYSMKVYMFVDSFDLMTELV